MKNLSLDKLFALPAAAVLYLALFLGFRRKIRFTWLLTSRIGHLSADFLICRAEDSISGIKRYYFLPEETCNQFLSKLIKRNLHASPWYRHFVTASRLFPLLGPFYSPPPLISDSSRDIHGVTQKVLPPPFFLSEDLAAIDILNRHGYRPSMPIVCLLVRDEYYLNDPTNLPNKNGVADWSYHNYRNSDPLAYVPAVQWLIEHKNAFVVRMGHSPLNPFPAHSPNLLDLAVSSEPHDFLDVWLFANATLTVSTLSGPDMISAGYGVPCAFINISPLCHAPSWARCLCAPKAYYWKRTGKPLTLAEYSSMPNFLETRQYEDYGISMRTLDSSTVSLIVQDAWAYFVDNVKPPSLEYQLKDEFISLMYRYHARYHDHVSPEFFLSRHWLNDTHCLENF
jgi:putative glycosyltransferase (TIGR04372 family)